MRAEIPTEQFRVRRLAVIDLHGAYGSSTRLWLVRVEFVIATVIAAALGGWFFYAGQVRGVVIGLVAVGIAANYLELTVWAALLRRGRLASEFRAHDIRDDGRFYSVGQSRLLIPFLFVVLSARECERRV